MVREVITYKDNFINFYKSQDSKIQEKLNMFLRLKKQKNLKKNV